MVKMDKSDYCIVCNKCYGDEEIVLSNGTTENHLPICDECLKIRIPEANKNSESYESKKMREMYEAMRSVKIIADVWDGDSYDEESNMWADKIKELFKDSVFNFMK